jgi:hypothetical protein
MIATKINDLQYFLEGNDKNDFVYVKVGSQFLSSDTRTIKKVEVKSHPKFKHCYLVTMAT